MKKILIIDDRQDFINGFINIAGTKDISVAHGKSFEELKQKMPRFHHKISVVILDIKCLLNNEQEIENEDFIGTAITFLDQNYPKFPRLILTGDDELFKGYRKFNKDEEVFLKTDEGIEKLFERVEYFCENSENLRIRREYEDVFEIFDEGLIPIKQEKQLINIFKNINVQNESEIEPILRDIRALQEMIYKSINLKNKTVVPDKFIRNSKDEMIIFNSLMKHLDGYPENNKATQKEYQNNAISLQAKSIYRVSSEYIHEKVKRTFSITPYTFKSLVYNLLDILLWAKQYLK